MSRPLRIQYPNAWYHVMNRGRRGSRCLSPKMIMNVLSGFCRRLLRFLLCRSAHIVWCRITITFWFKRRTQICQGACGTLMVPRRWGYIFAGILGGKLLKVLQSS